MRKKITITKKEFYEALMKQEIQMERYETCAKLRDTISGMTNPNEVYTITIDKKSRF